MLGSFTLALSLALVAAPAPTPSQVERALDAVLADGTYQTALPAQSDGLRWAPRRGPNRGATSPQPGGQPPDDDPSHQGAPPRPSASDPGDPGGGAATSDRAGAERANDSVVWRRGPRREAARRRPPLDSRSAGDDFGADLVLTLLVVLGALIVIGTLVAAVGRLRSRARVVATGASRRVSRAELEPDDVIVIDPPQLSLVERLAAQGRYTEAVHELLRLALCAASEQLSLPLARDATSRELLAELPIHASQREALSRLVQAVERGHFGQRDLDVDTFGRCRESFRIFEAGWMPT